jgi:DNA polymerase-3 subunit epsilon
VNGPLPSVDRPLKGCPVAVIDFEATGVDPDNDRAVSVAVVYIPALGESEPLPLLYTLLNPGVPIPKDSSDIHGITDEDVVDAPTFGEIADIVAEAVDGSLLCAYNLPYDYTMLRAEMKRCGHPVPLPFAGLDPLVWARHVFRYTGPKKKSLGSVAGHYKIEIEAHNALSDAMATATMLPLLLRDGGRGVPMDPRSERPIPAPALQSVDRFLRWQAPLAVEGEESFQDWLRRLGKNPGPNRWLQLTREARG